MQDKRLLAPFFLCVYDGPLFPWSHSGFPTCNSRIATGPAGYNYEKRAQMSSNHQVV